MARCELCDGEIVQRRKDARFCSKSCVAKKRRRKHYYGVCQTCHKETKFRHSTDRYCSSKCRTATYYLTYTPDKKQRIITSAKYRDKVKGRVSDLSLDNIHWPTHCPILGIELVYGNKGHKTGLNNSASIDRIDPTLGYTSDNCWIISKLANAMKQNASKEELLKFAIWVIGEYGNDAFNHS